MTDAKFIESRNWMTLKESLRDQLGSGWLYRGQRQAEWPLATTLERAVPDTTFRIGTEAALSGQFQAAALNFLEGVPHPTEQIEWLALMQHHGAPTRLLDFTLSPYVAAYFAVEDLEPNHTGAIWAINGSWCTERAGELLGAPPGDIVAHFLKIRAWCTDGMLPVSGVFPVQLLRKSMRQVIQQGVFLATGYAADSFDNSLRHLAGDAMSENVRCYLIPAACRGEILSDLRLMNITRASLFPGLDGFAQSLKYSLVQENPEAAALRRALRPSYLKT